MRFIIFIWIIFFLLPGAQGQNKKPKITGQKNLTTNQEQPITIHLTDLFVEESGDEKADEDDDRDSDEDKDDDDDKDDEEDNDSDDEKDDDDEEDNDDDDEEDDKDGSRTNAYPQGYTLEIFSGKNYAVSGNTVTPDPGYTGVLTVEVRVRNEKHASEKYGLKITVKPANSSDENQPPVITGQMPLNTPVNTPIDIQFSHLTVTDPDNDYPSDFTLQILEGNNYTVARSTVKPDQNFTGDLYVKVTVHDGTAASEVFELKVTVIADVNTRPTITGQVGLNLIEGQSLEIKLSHLVIVDDDNQYPEDFSLTVSAGDHYEVANHIITPVPGFLGILQVEITVNDGKDSSEPFDLKIQVAPKGKIEIVAQKSLEIPEDSSIGLHLSDLIVNDPSNTYPEGYSLGILKGENYEVTAGSIIPNRNFNGNLTVPVTVNKGDLSSAPFLLLIIVSPVNDPPELLKLETAPLVAAGTGPWVLTSTIEASDVDDDHLLYAEIGFNEEHYHPETDELLFESTENIHGVFDSENGMLFFLGSATPREYQDIIRSVMYNLKNAADTIQGEKIIYCKLNDGKDAGNTCERTVLLERIVGLEIPSAFTPNNDQANDTWKIIPLKQFEQSGTFIRVYNKNGILVFETNGLEKEWDGQFNGTPLPADVYFYTIEMDLSFRKVNYKGIVSILR